MRALSKPRTSFAALALAAVLCAGAAAAAEPAHEKDPVLRELLAETLANSPDLASGRELIQSERQRIAPAGALGDPMLSLSYQNDGFTSLPLGKMETTYLSIMATQQITLPGKRGLREDVAAFEVRKAEARLARTRLTLEAEVRRAYIDLLLVRDQLVLLAEIEALWQQAEGLAKTRYEVGEGSQADLFSAQLERSRLVQRRWTLEADERTRLAALNRLRVHPLDEPIATTVRLAQLGDPQVPDVEEANADALARSPELAEAAFSVEQAARQGELARKERVPDFSVSAGVMPRGALEPMWLLGVSAPLPIFAHVKQNRAVTEADLRRKANASGAEAVRQVLLLRTAERLNALSATVRSNKLYRDGILVLSRATVSSALSQYGVGRYPFASVLDVLNGYVGDQAGYLESAAQAHRFAIAQAELSLSATSSVGMGLSTGSVPGAGGGEMGKPMSAPSAAPATSGGASAPMPSGGGM